METTATQESKMSSIVVDMGWGDYRLADSPQTRVTAKQVEAFDALNVIEAGASEVRFGDETGEIFATRSDGSWIEIGTDGSYEQVEV